MDFKEFSEKCPWNSNAGHMKCKVSANGGPLYDCAEEDCGLIYAYNIKLKEESENESFDKC